MCAGASAPAARVQVVYFRAMAIDLASGRAPGAVWFFEWAGPGSEAFPRNFRLRVQSAAGRRGAGDFMHTVAFVTQKGGAGKTTLAISMAAAARLAGERVFIFDLDPLQSLVKWSAVRTKLDIPVQFSPPEKLAAALGRLAREDVTLAIVDTPGADSEHAESAIRAADFCILPARPNVLDLWASEATLAKVRATGKDFAFLLNQCPPKQQSARVEQGARALQEMGGLLAPMVSLRVDYQEAVRRGLGVGELNPKGAAALEMAQLWESVSRRLAGGRAAARGEEAGERSSAFTPYQDLLDHAVKVGGLYSNLLNAFLPFGGARPSETAAPEPPVEVEVRRRRMS